MKLHLKPDTLAPTCRRTESNEHWKRSCFNDWASCCWWQHLWGTALEMAINTIQYNTIMAFIEHYLRSIQER